ncbi:MAG: Holliday junction DNA helicase RuvB [Elusimicrobia bacterium GWC2_51_8]|nr:MAG: Holliday junction DNA helicase RuvB [Elusimicrobia bacterium GWA2_51_34]OGR58719.1 MAG: Holliday junction DNA helicase RuvB [Elusimicrobia bacterium GWC2_51_8]OGR88154.1 MAG: Holliday junction DNA helicase RuvB [Elusimicrobia bacterium GWF2_52_66]HAF95357.1 Holliday junction branch migration DNA helicase RuvB [Elusimicrobiota bacterium]HCE98779.1 Holliday junction branch migration DNA helicase RuvB [Elusimicrobiota bacterium]
MSKEENPLSPTTAPGENARFDSALRPLTLKDFIGQKKLKENLDISIRAAKNRGEALDHCLFYSPPGLGKTTLSHILAREMGVNIKVTSGPVLSKPGDLAAMLTTELAEGDILFIDEIHRLNAAVEEALYPVMEDFIFFISTGKGPGSTTLKLAVPRFTLVGATTRSGLLTGPLRDRFGLSFNLGFYGEAEIEAILERSAAILGTKASAQGLKLIAARSRGTPRIANRLLKRVRDFAEVKGAGVITPEITEAAMASLEIDSEGLDNLDRRLLLTIAEKFEGGPVGIETLAVSISEEQDTLTDVIEPFLMQSGFLKRTTRGRVLTPKAARHLGFKLPRQQELL